MNQSGDPDPMVGQFAAHSDPKPDRQSEDSDTKHSTKKPNISLLLILIAVGVLGSLIVFFFLPSGSPEKDSQSAVLKFMDAISTANYESLRESCPETFVERESLVLPLRQGESFGYNLDLPTPLKLTEEKFGQKIVVYNSSSFSEWQVITEKQEHGNWCVVEYPTLTLSVKTEEILPNFNRSDASLEQNKLTHVTINENLFDEQNLAQLLPGEYRIVFNDRNATSYSETLEVLGDFNTVNQSRALALGPDTVLEFSPRQSILSSVLTEDRLAPLIEEANQKSTGCRGTSRWSIVTEGFDVVPPGELPLCLELEAPWEELEGHGLSPIEFLTPGEWDVFIAQFGNAYFLNTVPSTWAVTHDDHGRETHDEFVLWFGMRITVEEDRLTTSGRLFLMGAQYRTIVYGVCLSKEYYEYPEPNEVWERYCSQAEPWDNLAELFDTRNIQMITSWLSGAQD